MVITVYPIDIDSTSNYPNILDNITALQGSIINNLRDAIIAVETELGIKPSGIYGTVRARLDMLEDLLNQLLSSLSGLTNGITFVFRPGGVTSGNVFSTWNALYTSLHAFNGPRIVEIDTSLDDASIPSGTYLLDGNVEFRGVLSLREPSEIIEDISLPIPLTLENGCILRNPSKFVNLRIINTSSSECFQFNQEEIDITLENSSLDSATSKFFTVNSLCYIYLDKYSFLQDSGFPIFDIPANYTAYIYASELSSVQDDTVSGAALGALILNINSPSSNVSTSFSGFSGTLSINKNSHADYISYDDSLASPTLGADDVQTAIDALKAMASSGSTPVFVFQPGGVATNNVYITWASLYADLITVYGPRIIEFDTSITSPAVIPAGSYNFDKNVLLIGKSRPTNVTLSDNVIITNFYKAAQGLHITTAATTVSPITVATSTTVLLEDNVTLDCSGTKSFFTLSGTATLNVYLNKSTFGSGTKEVVTLISGTTLITSVTNLSTVDTNTVLGPVGSFFTFLENDGTNTLGTQANFLGTATDTLNDKANSLFYLDSIPLLGSSDVQGAINALKVLPVSGDLSGTLPSPTVTDLTITGEVQGSILYRNATNWVQLSPGTSGYFLKTNGAAANPAWTPPTATDLNISGQVQGSILYYNGTNWVQLSPGTSGQLLKTNGAAANPAWTNPGLYPPDQRIFYGVAGEQQTNATTSVGVGAFLFDPSAIPAAGFYTRTLFFVAILEVTTGFTAEIKLYNITAGATASSTTLTTTATSPTKVISSALTIGASPNIPNAENLYEVQLRISTGSPGSSDRAICKSAYMLVTYT